MEYFEIHQQEFEEMQAFLQEQENLALMERDWEESGGHLWD